MKRFGNLYAEIVSEANMLKAIDAALASKAWKREASRILAHREEAAKWLSAHPFPENRYRAKSVVDAASGKRRDLLVPCAADLVRQHAAMQVIQPLLERGFYEHSFACRKGKGATRCAMYARSRLSRMARRRTYFAKIDVVKYYDSVDPSVMKSLLRRVLKDREALSLMDAIIDGTGKPKGLPIGNFTSQIFANVYLTPADRYAKQALKVPLYVRYADDMLLASNNKRTLKKQVEALVEFIERSLHLKCHRERIQIRALSDSGDGFVDLCGFKMYKSHIHVRKRTFLRIRRTAAALSRRVTLSKARSFMSYWGYLKRADCASWTKEALSRFRLSDLRKAISESDRRRAMRLAETPCMRGSLHANAGAVKSAKCSTESSTHGPGS